MLKYEGINFVPTEAMAKEASRGLEWRREYRRGGTSVGVARARDIKNRAELSPSTVKRMRSFFARHEVDKEAEGFRPGEDGYPSAGRIAWALWGGDPGKAWADSRVERMNSQDESKEPVFNDLKGFLDVELKDVPPVQDLPIDDGEWDGDAARKRLQDWAAEGDAVDFERYELGFAYFDEEAMGTFAAYKLPHHDVVDGKLVTSRRGVFAAMAALMGARGGVDLPDSERKEVYDHLAGHYEQMGETPPEYRSADESEVKLLKAYKNNVNVKADEPRTVVARISTTSVDRDGDVVLPSGLKLQDYRKNPVVLLNHDNGSLPVGKALSVKREADAVIAKIKFAERPAEHPITAEWVPDTILSLFKQGVLRAFSVGFMPLDMRGATDKDRKRYGDDVRRVITSWNLMEFSVVPVPANQDALAMEVSKSSGFLREAWCLPATSKLVVPKMVMRISDPENG
tara:strand:- start:1912 stop:3279 length:1368 start_codon:yes stop_codon:yes gene_type:complete